MVFDYYIQSELVIIYYDDNGGLSTTKTNRFIQKGYLTTLPQEDSDEDDETQYNNWEEELNRVIQKNTYKKILYENGLWIKDSYCKKYLQEINSICPRILKLVKVYKDYSAWKR